MSFKNRISTKLKHALSDAFNQEKRITRHFIDRAEFLAKNNGGIQGILSLQIIESEGVVSATLFKGKTAITAIPLDTIALFFTNQLTAHLISSSHIEEKLKKYFNFFQRDLDIKSVGVRIVILKNETVKIYTLGTQDTKEVLLTEFINFFKS